MNEPRPRTEAQLLELLRSSDVRAPQELHRQVQAMIAESASPRRGWTRALLFAIGGRSLGRGLAGTLALAAVVVVVAVLAVALPGGGGSGLSLREATALTLGPAKAPAPPESARGSAELATAVQGVHFPYWEGRFGWRSTGLRTDRVGGRTVTTVFYSNRTGQRIGYAIVAGTPAPRMGGGVIAWHGNTAYHLLGAQGAPVVAWLREGRLCVLSGRGVDGATLMRLARWGDGPTSPA